MNIRALAGLGLAIVLAASAASCAGLGKVALPSFPAILATDAPTPDVARQVANRFDVFWNHYKHQPIEYEDPDNPDQCMDAAFAYVHVVGIPVSVIEQGRARDVPTGSQIGSYFDVQADPTTTTPPKGALVIIDSSDPAGHIAMATGDSGRKNGDLTFDAISQNWNGVQRLEKDTFKSKHVIAILVPKNIGPQGDFLP